MLSSVLAGWTVLGLACSVEDENPAPNRPRGTSEAGASSSSSNGSVGEQPTGAPLCNKYGGVPNVIAIADGIVVSLLDDCRIGIVVENGRKNDAKHFDECFHQFVGGGFQCAGMSFTAGQTTDKDGRKCNKQLEGVTFSDADFNAFLDVVAKTLKTKGLTDDEVRAVAPVFEGARLRMVDPALPRNKHQQCKPNCNLAKGDACVQPIIDAGADGNTQDSGGGGGGMDSGSEDGGAVP
jgi:hypothetical protein